MKHFCFQMFGCSEEYWVLNELFPNVTVIKTFLPIIAPFKSQAATTKRENERLNEMIGTFKSQQSVQRLIHGNSRGERKLAVFPKFGVSRIRSLICSNVMKMSLLKNIILQFQQVLWFSGHTGNVMNFNLHEEQNSNGTFVWIILLFKRLIEIQVFLISKVWSCNYRHFAKREASWPQNSLLRVSPIK